MTAQQIGGTIKLGFTLPSEAVDGENLTKPLGIEIFRKIHPPGSKPGPENEPVAHDQKPWLLLKDNEVAASRGQGRAEYEARLSPDDFQHSVGHVFAFSARGFTRGFRGRPIESDLSNTATLVLLDVPQPVTGLGVVTTERSLNVSWSAPERTMVDRPAGAVEAYRIFRSDAPPASTSTSEHYRLVGEAHQTSYADSTFQFDHFYSYRVRAVITERGVTAESSDSAAVEIVPLDTFPPAVPADLTGLYTSDAVELIWQPNLESDLAGYNLERREDVGQARRLNPGLLRSPLYRDTAVTSGHHYFYRVSAVDLNGNESGPSSEVEVGVP